VTTINLSTGKAIGIRADVLVIGAVSDGDAVSPAGPGGEVAAAFGRTFAPTLSSLGFRAGVGEIAKIPSAGVVRSPLVLVVGLGEEPAPGPDALRRAAGTAIRSIRNAATVAFALPTSGADDVQAVAEGALLGAYAFTTYKTGDEPDPVGSVMVLAHNGRSKEIKQAATTARVVATAVNRARDWVNTPPRDLTPALFAAAASAVDSPAKVRVSVWDEARLETERCGGILGVGQGSANPPRLVQLVYKPRKPVAHLALVGKGITYDSGGITLKPAAGLMTMKCDMAGAAAVISATFAIAELGLPVQVTCFAAMAENMPSGTATRPGDVLTLRSGSTVEVHNTDAEGRLVLADALTLATEQGPDLVVDVATLTGACIVALGTRTAGVMANDPELLRSIPDTAELAGEAMWPLPIPDEMRKKVKSSAVADLRQHNPEPYGGTLYAASFLREFVGGSRWAHLDIAGPAFNDGEPFGYTPKGGTGASVRTLVKLVQKMADGA
jgi:leucyl aminopeptidase